MKTSVIVSGSFSEVQQDVLCSNGSADVASR